MSGFNIGGAPVGSISCYFPDPPDESDSILFLLALLLMAQTARPLLSAFPEVFLGFGVLFLYDFIQLCLCLKEITIKFFDVERLAMNLNIAHNIPSSMEDSFSHLIRN